MDPTPCAGAPARSRLPRTRGDGPHHSAALQHRRLASPHSRGWTHGLALPRRRAHGFPALAGMDRLLGFHRRYLTGLPRTRGDGPSVGGPKLVRTGASPHSRGWTQHPALVHPPDQGFPALAGMDPRLRLPMRSALGLPRTRGDGPLVGPGADAHHLASPHSRGWTHLRVGHVRDPCGFPALAGMDHLQLHGVGRLIGLPRTRGDGPISALCANRYATASPHSRGWTSGGAGEQFEFAGFPALAGMDPEPRGGWSKSNGLPRC